MKSISGHSDETERARSDGRWIRPAHRQRTGSVEARKPRGAAEGKLSEEQSIEKWAGILLEETRERVSGLTAVERQLEDTIRRRWEESAAEMERSQVTFRRELGRMRSEVEKEIDDIRGSAAKEGRSEGFREGLARGREEGYRLGLEEGRREGLEAGQRDGLEEGARQISSDLSKAAASMALAAQELSEDRARLLQEARSHLVALAMQTARRVVKHELTVSEDVTLRTVEAAIELIFRRGTVVVQVHPGDATYIEKALQAEPRWAEGFEAVDVHSSSSVTRGGCRLVSGAGTVDMTIETQMELLERALEEAIQRPEAASSEPVAAGELPESHARKSGGDPS